MITEDELPKVLHDWLLCQSKEKIVEIMFEALDLMQQYNGRSRRYCVCTAADLTPLKDGGWVIPKMTPAIEPGASYWLNIAHSQVAELRDTATRLREDPLSLAAQIEHIDEIISYCRSIDQRITEHKEKAL
jgi:hypothetical protein